jgi:hypothetical protein
MSQEYKNKFLSESQEVQCYLYGDYSFYEIMELQNNVSSYQALGKGRTYVSFGSYLLVIQLL